ncbi:MAG: hypothetical protein VKL60_17680 [Sphaerospermopsis sp.]|nr:hypothetical protein [Sphaerospermopsis sp.]
MISKIKDKIIALNWNLSFILIGLLVTFCFHIYINTLTCFCLDEISLYKEIGNEEEFQRNGATKITKSGRVIVQDFTLGAEAAAKKDNANQIMFFIGIMVIAFPVSMILYMIIYSRISLLAVNRNLSLLILFLLSSGFIIWYELQSFISSGRGQLFMISVLSSLIINGWSAFFIYLQPKELSSPYYRSKTELITDEIQLAA